MEDARYLVVPRAAEQAAVATERTGSAHARYLLVVLTASLVLGYAADFLFYGRQQGVSVPIFVGLFIAGLMAALRVKGVELAWRNLWLLAPLLFFTAMVPLRANAQLTTLNLLAVVGCAGLLVYFAAGGRSWALGVLGYPAVLGVVGKWMLVAPVPELVSARRIIPDRRRMRRLVPVLRGLALALPVLVVFGALLASADKFFADFLTDTFRLKSLDNFGEALWHIVSILLVAWVTAGALLFAATRGEHEEAGAEGRVRFGPLIGSVEGATILALVNVMFVTFAWLQFANIFFAQPSTEDFEAYREYVRRGFGELLVVCVLTLLLILSVRRLADFRSPRAKLLYRILATLMVALTGVMLVSAYWRMDYWQEVMFYISTPLRIYVTVFIMWLAGLFGWLLLTLWLGRLRFGIGALLAVVGFLMTVNLMNPDANVAASNLALEDELSTRYLWALSEDAVPALARGLDTVRDPVVRESLREHLQVRLQGIEWERAGQEWPEFHFSEEEAYRTLKALQARGELK